MRPLPLSVSAADAERVANDQMRVVLEYSRQGLTMATLFAIVLAAYLHNHVDQGLLAGWLAVKLAVSAWRWWLSDRFWRTERGGASWRRSTVMMLALDGAVWGLAGFWCMSNSLPTASLVAAALTGIACVATFGLQVWWQATAAYVLPIILPMLAALVLRADQVGWLGAMGMAALLVLQLFTSARAERSWLEGQLLRLQAQQLLHDKEEALALAQRQSSVKSQFVANVSHELRTPLHGILGLTHLLRSEAMLPTATHRLELIEASGTHLLGLINDLLDVSRIEAGRFAIRPQPFELVAQIEQVAEVFELRTQEKGLAFHRRIELGESGWVNGDAGRLRQVLHNLLGNALKFTDSGSITLAIRRNEGQPDLIHADVIDTGPGIAKQDMSRLFEAFAQGPADSAQPRAGTGLGLTIAREIARSMGGDILVNSRLGHGATFTLLARLPTVAAPSDVLIAASTPSMTQVWRPSNCCILVADDDDVNAIIIAAQLEQLGATMTRAHDGTEAVTRAMSADARPALVLMDCQMPRMDGLSATRVIREMELQQGLPPIPVVAMTASMAETDMQRCRSNGMDDFLGKPFTPDELRLVLQRWLEPAMGRA